MKRLFDDPALSGELRADLEGSRSAGHDYETLAKLPQLREALESSRVPLGTETSSQLALLSAAWKIALVVGVIGAVAYVAWPEAPRTEPVKVMPPSVVVPAPIPEVKAPEAPAPLPAPEVAAEPEPAPAPVAKSSRREIAQLVRIRALLSSDPAAAYRLAQRSEREFPRGVLSEERQALQVMALAKSGDLTAAQRKAKAFFAHYPESPMRELVEGALRH